MTPEIANKLSKIWIKLRNITPENGNEIDAYENLYYNIDALNKYDILPLDNLTYFEQHLLFEYFFIKSNKLTESEIRKFYYMEGKYDSTVYELGVENRIFGVILPTVFYEENSIPVLVADIV